MNRGSRLCSPNAHTSRPRASVIVCEDDDAVIKMTIKGSFPTTRHVSWIHRVDMEWLFDQIILDPGIRIKYVDTSKQIADILTKGSFSRDGWSQLTQQFHLMTPLHDSCSHFSVFIYVRAERRHDVRTSGTTCHRKFLSQTEACAQAFSRC